MDLLSNKHLDVLLLLLCEIDTKSFIFLVRYAFLLCYPIHRLVYTVKTVCIHDPLGFLSSYFSLLFLAFLVALLLFSKAHFLCFSFATSNTDILILFVLFLTGIYYLRCEHHGNCYQYEFRNHK